MGNSQTNTPQTMGTRSVWDFHPETSSVKLQAVQIHLAASLHEQQNAAAAGQDGRLTLAAGLALRSEL